MQLTGDFKSNPKRNAAPHEETTKRHPYKWEKDENKNTNKQIKPSTAIFVEIRHSYCEVAKNKPQAEKKRNDIPLKQWNC